MTEQNIEMITEALSSFGLLLYAMGVSVTSADGKLIFYDNESKEGFSIPVDQINMVQ